MGHRGKPGIKEKRRQIERHVVGQAPVEARKRLRLARGPLARVLAAKLADIVSKIGPGDIVLLHDPQTAGLVTALANGSATVTARTDDLSGTAAVVVEQTVATVHLSPPDTVLTAIGDTVRLTASALDARGQPVAKETAWISSATSVATVRAFGLGTAGSKGAAGQKKIASGKPGRRGRDG